MLRIRLRRVGKRGRPAYRIVVAESRAPRDGAYLDWIGTYDPMKDPPAFTLKTDRANEWLGKGAQPSDAVKRILAIDRLSEIQDLRATEEELDSRIEEIAEKSGDTPAQIYANLQKSERLEALEREITERKVFDFLKEQSEITEN